MLRSAALLCGLLVAGQAAGIPVTQEEGQAPLKVLRGHPDPGQKTKQGCTCTSECGGTIDIDQAKKDWCYTANNCGLFSPHLLASYDFCIYPANYTYEAQTAAVKQAIVWAKCAQDPTGGKYPEGPELLKIFAESIRTTFDDNQDFMPAGRVKYIHSVGSIAQFEFIPAADTPYSGLFKTGGTGIIRMSSAKAPDATIITPGFGIKFFRDSQPSANFMAMPSLDGQTNFNFFEKVFTNHPGMPSGFQLKLLTQKFWQASRCALRVGLSDTAQYDNKGRVTARPRFPWVVRFEPTGKVQFPSSPYNETMLNHHFSRIPAGTELFNVTAWDTPNDEKDDFVSMKVHLGQIRTTSPFMTSTYGDKTLMFRHVYTEFDLRIRGEWFPQIKADEKNICGMTGISVDPPTD